MVFSPLTKDIISLNAESLVIWPAMQQHGPVRPKSSNIDGLERITGFDHFFLGL